MSATPTTNARHSAHATTPPWVLTLKFLAGFRWRYLARFPSNYAWMVLRRKYDAFATDRAYEDEPRSWLGPLGRWADRRVLDYPLHVGLRQRLELVTTGIEAAVHDHIARGAGEVRVLSAPAGLCRDLIQATGRVAASDPGIASRVRLFCLDLDQTGDVIPEARRRLAAAGLDATFYREDAFDASGPAAAAVAGGPFHVVNCIGLSAWVSLDEVQTLATRFRALQQPGGVLVMDNFAWHEHSNMGSDLEIDTNYHPPAELMARLEVAGYRVDHVWPTANGVCTVHVATAT